MVKFFKLDRPIPKSITVAGRAVRTIYSGQDMALKKFAHEQNRTIRPPTKRQQQQQQQKVERPEKAYEDMEADSVKEDSAADDENQYPLPSPVAQRPRRQRIERRNPCRVATTSLRREFTQ